MSCCPVAAPVNECTPAEWLWGSPAQPDGGGLWVGDRGCDPRNDWPLCLAATCPLVVAGPGPVGGAGL